MAQIGGQWLHGALAIAFILLVAFLASRSRRAIRLRVVGTALLAQILIGAFILYSSLGRQMVGALASGVEALMGYSKVGIDMLFGQLASDQFGMNLAIHVLPVIIFFAALSSVLYYLKIMPLVVKVIGGLLGRGLGIGRVEALCAAANICVGQSESPLVIKPYLKSLTSPQLFAIMVSGMAGVAGTILAAYAQLGINLDYLLAASFMSAPGGLLMAKIIMPDQEQPAAPDEAIVLGEDDADRPKNLIMAIAEGTNDGIQIAVSVGAMILSFVALIALANGLLGAVGNWVHLEGLTFQKILGLIFAPLMYVIQIPWAEAVKAGGLFGERLITNEFVAYMHLMEPGQALSARSQAIMSFALCGFANLGSIAIQLAVIGGLVPALREKIVEYGLLALFAATLANLMNAAIAGLFLP